jgi:uncharacterized protein
MHEIKREFGKDRRFRLDFQHLRNMGGDGGRTVVQPLSLDELAQVQQHLTNVYNKADTDSNKCFDSKIAEAKESLDSNSIINTSIGSYSESAGSRRKSEKATNEPYICYAAKPNNLTIRANGRVGKCTVALDDKRNDLGFLNSEGQLVLDNDKHKLWFRGLETLDLTTAGCPLKGMPKYEGKSSVPEEPIRWLNR